MKHFLTFAFLLVLIMGCHKNNTGITNSPIVCFNTSFINTNIADNLLSVFFLTGKDGFVTGYNGGIYKTLDSAKTWTKLNSTTTLPVRAVHFINSNIGLAIGGNNSCGGTGCIPAGGFILRTQDGGQHWTNVHTPLDKVELTSICFINATTGFCIGDNIVFKTIDGGLTWSENKINNIGGKMMKVSFVNNQVGFIVCLFGKILKTTNAGNTWEIMTINKNIGYYAASSSNRATYISGQGKILKSTNDGNSWTELPNAPIDIFDVKFTDSNVGYAFGRGNYSGGDFGRYYGSMFCTNNGGETWNGNGNFIDVGPIQAVSFPAAKLGYAISDNKIIKVEID